MILYTLLFFVSQLIPSCQSYGLYEAVRGQAELHRKSERERHDLVKCDLVDLVPRVRSTAWNERPEAIVHTPQRTPYRAPSSLAPQRPRSASHDNDDNTKQHSSLPRHPPTYAARTTAPLKRSTSISLHAARVAILASRRTRFSGSLPRVRTLPSIPLPSHPGTNAHAT